MLKFFIIFISLSMISFGGIFSIALNDKEDALRRIKEKLGDKTLSEDKIEIINKTISNMTIISFIALVLGICLFIASLFL